MARGFRYEQNRSGVRDTLLNNKLIQKEVKRVAEEIAARAKATAPVDETTPESYKDSIKARRAAPTDRFKMEVGSDADYAIHVEVDTGNISRAIDGVS